MKVKLCKCLGYCHGMHSLNSHGVLQDGSVCVQRYKEPECYPLQDVVQHNHTEGMELQQAQGRVIVTLMRSWLQDQRVKGGVK